MPPGQLTGPSDVRLATAVKVLALLLPWNCDTHRMLLLPEDPVIWKTPPVPLRLSLKVRLAIGVSFGFDAPAFALGAHVPRCFDSSASRRTPAWECVLGRTDAMGNKERSFWRCQAGGSPCRWTGPFVVSIRTHRLLHAGAYRLRPGVHGLRGAGS